MRSPGSGPYASARAGGQIDLLPPRRGGSWVVGVRAGSCDGWRAGSDARVTVPRGRYTGPRFARHHRRSHRAETGCPARDKALAICTYE